MGRRTDGRTSQKQYAPSTFFKVGGIQTLLKLVPLLQNVLDPRMLVRTLHFPDIFRDKVIL